MNWTEHGLHHPIILIKRIKVKTGWALGCTWSASLCQGLSCSCCHVLSTVMDCVPPNCELQHPLGPSRFFFFFYRCLVSTMRKVNQYTQLFISFLHSFFFFWSTRDGTLPPGLHCARWVSECFHTELYSQPLTKGDTCIWSLPAGSVTARPFWVKVLYFEMKSWQTLQTLQDRTLL